MIIDPDAEKKMEGVAMLRSIVDQSGGRLDYDLLFSDEGIRSTIIFRDLVTDAAGNFTPTSKLDAMALKARVAVDASGDVVRKAGARKELRADEVAFVIKEDLLMEGMAGEIGNILKRRFPVIQDAIKQNEKYVELVSKHGDEGAQAVDYLRKHPAAATEVSPALKRMAPFHEKARKYFYSPAADIQSKIFMGMNPGYIVTESVTLWLYYPTKALELLGVLWPQEFSAA